MPEDFSRRSNLKLCFQKWNRASQSGAKSIVAWGRREKRLVKTSQPQETSGGAPHTPGPACLEHWVVSCLRSCCSRLVLASMHLNYTPRPGKDNPVLCVETGVEYVSIREAARAMGVTDMAIHKALKKGYRSCGYTWQRILPEYSS
eukprot:g4490.t1